MSASVTRVVWMPMPPELTVAPLVLGEVELAAVPRDVIQLEGLAKLGPEEVGVDDAAVRQGDRRLAQRAGKPGGQHGPLEAKLVIGRHRLLPRRPPLEHPAEPGRPVATVLPEPTAGGEQRRHGAHVPRAAPAR